MNNNYTTRTVGAANITAESTDAKYQQDAEFYHRQFALLNRTANLHLDIAIHTKRENVSAIFSLTVYCLFFKICKLLI